MEKSFATPIADLLHMQRLLQMEYDYEVNNFAGIPDMNGVMAMVRRGDCKFPVTLGGNRYNSLNRLEVEVNDVEINDFDNNFEYGKPVSFFSIYSDGTIKTYPFQATVWRVEEDGRTIIIMPDTATLSELRCASGELGMRIHFDNFSYKAMFAALKNTINANGRLAELRNILKGAKNPEFREVNTIRYPWLNKSQELAVNKVISAKDVAIVHGPPGTGKTTTLVEAINETLQRETQVLVCAQSNMAVDWISEKLCDRGISVLRIGNPTRVNDKMLNFTYERRFESHPDYHELWNIRKSLRERVKNADYRDKLKERAVELEYRINNDLFAEARVIACTLVGSANMVLENRRFSTLFIDEAAQALEPACWIAIAKCNRVIFAGDHWQLPPTVKCFEAEKGGLAQTLMMKIARNKPSSVTLLNTQYRMHEEIMQFSSDWFYNGELKAAPDVQYRGILDYDSPIMWIDTSDTDWEESCVGNVGKLNKGEADIVINYLKQYIDKIGIERILDERIDFGVISPYRAQVRYLRKAIRTDKTFSRVRRLITVHTVDGFQGQERDVIFISLVRSNSDGNIGFLRDLRRMNVAMTRARMKLVISGDASTLSKHPFYKRLVEYIDAKGIFIPSSFTL